MHATARIATACLALTLAGCGGVSAPTAAPSQGATPGPASSPATPSPVTSPAVTARPTPTAATAQLEVAGLTREYVVVTPPDVADREPLPLLLALHAATMTMGQMEGVTSYDDMAMDPGAVVVYPQGVDKIWNAGATDTGVDDVAFISALIDRMESTYPIDPDRIFVMGASNGGQMAYRAACVLSDRIAAVGDVIGALLVDCQPDRPVSVIDIHGTQDKMIPIEGGGTGCRPIDCPPLADTMDRWRQIDGCAGDPTMTQDPQTVETTWSVCDGGTAVTFITAIGKGHDWYFSGPDDRAVTWAFFMSHPRSAGS